MKIQHLLLASASAGLLAVVLGTSAQAARPNHTSGDTCPIGQTYNPLTSICEGQAVESINVPSPSFSYMDEGSSHVTVHHHHRTAGQNG